MKKSISKFIVVTINIILTAIGASLGLKAAIGVTAWDALSQTISTVLFIKVGTLSMILNISCVLLQLFLLKKEFKLKHALQVFASILVGLVINYVYYDICSNFTVNSYFTSLILLFACFILCAFAVSVIMAVNFISFPLESACMVVAKRINKNFGSIRQAVDILSIIISVAVALIFRNKLTVREGTIIGMFIYGPLIDWFMKIITPTLRKFSLVE
jgi:uncharacterized membrane protein YczE